ncbi:hypothetical protein BDR05DRAFT_1005618 [Suillus weaverae]|nr:hypothetical protein BDR05DRAFT_1005618 [Suillus weaverae]
MRFRQKHPSCFLGPNQSRPWLAPADHFAKEMRDAKKEYDRFMAVFHFPLDAQIILAGLSIASDSTSHRRIDYASRPMAIRASDYTNGTDSAGSSVKIRSLGVASSASHASEIQVEGYISPVFKDDPLACRSQEILARPYRLSPQTQGHA